MPYSDQEIKSLIDNTNQRISELENSVEELFYSLISNRLSKKTIEEILELAVCEYFGNISKKDFMGKSFSKIGNPVHASEEDRNIIDARKWFMSIARNVLLKGPHKMRISYDFYNIKKESKHRPVYESALLSKDLEQRKILLGISAIVKRICKAEGVLSEDFEYL